METFLGLLAFAAVVAVVIYVGSLKDKAVEKGVGAVNRKIHAKSQVEGTDYVNSVFFFPTAATTEQIVTALKSGVQADGEPSLLLEGLSVDEVGADRVRWAYGKKFARSFEATAIAGAEAGMEDGTSLRGLMLRIHDTSTLDGVVHGVTAMRALVQDVERALRTVDPTTERIVWES